MFKGYSEEFKRKLEEYNQNSNFFCFCVYDLEYSPDRMEGEIKFDFYSSELRQKLGNIIVSNGGMMSNPRGIKFPSLPDRIKQHSIRNHYTWIKFDKKILTQLANDSNGRIIEIPSKDKKTKEDIDVMTKLNTHFATGMTDRILKLDIDIVVVMNWMSEKMNKVRETGKNALKEINQTLTETGIDIKTAEIDWMAILPDWCACEVKELGNLDNDILYKQHINSCLWREEDEITTFKDKVVEAIRNKFNEHKKQVIKNIIKQASNKGVSESELEKKQLNWKDELLSEKKKEWVNDFQKVMEHWITLLSSTSNNTNRNTTNDNNQSNPESETNNDRDNPTNKPSITPNNQTSLRTLKEQVAQTITNALELEPQLTNSDLSSEYQDWKSQINKLTEETTINSYKDRVLSHIQQQRKDKKSNQEVNENLQKATNPNATIQDKKDALENLDKNEGESAYEEKKEETKQVKKEVAKDNPNEYRDKVVSDLNKKLTDNGLNEGDLDSQTQQEIKDLKNGHDLDADKLVETEIKITEKIGQAGAKKKIDNIISKVEAVKKNKKEKDETQIKELKEQLLEIINSTNVYYAKYKSRAKMLLGKLENYAQTPIFNSQKNIDKGLSTPTKIMIGIGIFLVIVFFSYLMWTQQKNPKWMRGKIKGRRRKY